VGKGRKANQAREQYEAAGASQLQEPPGGQSLLGERNHRRSEGLIEHQLTSCRLT